MPFQKKPEVTAAVVGAGLMGRWHADAIRRSGGRVIAVVDPDEKRAVELARRHAPARVYPCLEDALSQCRPTVVHLCTPANLHRQQAEQALNAGAHVIVEKPLAQTWADTQEILNLAEKNKLLVCPVHQFVFQDGAQRLRGWLASSGKIVQVSFTIRSAGGAGLPTKELDALVADILPHPLSLLQMLIPDSLDIPWMVDRPAPGELRIIGTTGAGVGMAIEISMNARPPQNSMIIASQEATFSLDLFHGFSVRYPGTVSRTRKVIQPFEFSLRQFGAASGNLFRRLLTNESAYPGLRRLVSLFYQAVRSGGISPIPPHDTLAVARARQVILAS
ncbi:MAG: Gfo/Idh/MocA family oxidoreductase [Chloroflexota bacterium]